jgi:hypothetical protein
MIPGGQMTHEHIQRDKSKATDMVAEITKTYARKGKAQAPMTKKDTPLMAAPIQQESLNFSLEGELAKIKIPVPLKDLICMSGQKEVMSRFVGSGNVTNLSDENPQIFLGMGKNDNDPAPFYISLLVNGLILRNCMLDSGASTNVMTLEIMCELGLQITKPYRNVQAVDAREIQVCGVNKNLQVRLHICPLKVFAMDVVVIDCPVKWGMLLSRKWAVDVGGNIQMDWSYADILITPTNKVRLFWEQKCYTMWKIHGRWTMNRCFSR